MAKGKKIIKTGKKQERLPPRIVIKFLDSLKMPYTSDEAIRDFLLKQDVFPLEKLMKEYPGITIGRLFTLELNEIIKSVARAKELNPEYKAPNFLTYCVIECPLKHNAGKLMKVLRENKIVECTYIESEPAPPPCVINGTNPGHIAQGYLDPAPRGIDARFAWTVNGGCGEGKVQFIDIEYAWILDHEDLASSPVQFVWGDQNRKKYNEHGTWVLGVILMQDNGFGGLGIARNVKAKVVSQISPALNNAIPSAIIQASANLNPGDILLLEVQVFDEHNIYRPSEIEPAIFDAIKLATNQGIIVIEAAGNGDETRGYNLDDFADENGSKILDRIITNPDFKESGAIMVGAASDSDEHGKTRTSNYGNRVDCFGWGSHVFTTDKPSDHPNDPPYTDDFNGTSSASAIIAGAAISIQSIVEASGSPRLSPSEMRAILSNPATGTPSRNAIGVMPDLRAIITALGIA